MHVLKMLISYDAFPISVSSNIFLL